MSLNAASKRPKFGPIDGIALFPFLFLLLSPSMFTFWVLCGFSIFLIVLDYWGLKLAMLWRFSRNLFAGDSRIIRPLTRKKI
jgi:hypothetical protein